MSKILLLVITSLYLTTVLAKGVYQRPTDFVTHAYAGTLPEPRVLYLKGEVKKIVKAILGHRYNKIRIRYWLQDGRSTWILDEIGKEKSITTGIVINGKGIEHIKVLIFRESRGWEVRHDFFTQQFTDASLDVQHQLDRHIDGITGATLSVRAVTGLARMALYLHSQVTKLDA